MRTRFVKRRTVSIRKNNYAVTAINEVPAIQPAHDELSTQRRAAVGHQIIERLLRLGRLLEVTRFQHFATVANHFTDGSRVVFTLVRSVEIYAACVLILIRQLAKPWAAQHLLTGGWTKPDLATCHVLSDIRTVGFPPINLIGRDRQATAAIQRAALAALIAVFQQYLPYVFMARASLRFAALSTFFSGSSIFSAARTSASAASTSVPTSQATTVAA